MPVNPILAEVTARIESRSQDARGAYLEQIERARSSGPSRGKLSCANWAHAFAGSPAEDKARALTQAPNIGIVTSYNDMLSAHQPLEHFPEVIRAAAREVGATAQVAGGVPAMCDGVTQGRPGMELSLFSRDVIAMATAVALSHDAFDGALALGVCDKIVPGLMIGALSFGHLPTIFVPGGPMTSGLSNAEKAKVRGLYAEGKVGRDELLKAEMGAYHGPGTCTFYGTANSNQMLMELMGVHLPGSAFVHPYTPLREALTRAAAQRVVELRDGTNAYAPLGWVIDAKAIVNGLVGLMATGGSTNHALHIVAIARAAGITVDWTDFDDISRAVPLLARVYPNGSGDVNQFQAAGGLAFLTRELLDAGLLHEDVLTAAGKGLRAYTSEPFIEDGRLVWKPAPAESLDSSMLRPVSDPFDREGGLRLLTGNLGRAVIKTSAVKPEHRVVEAPAIVFDSQEGFLAAFKAGQIDRDFVAVVRFQGPRANGMPELHSLTPSLSVLQDRGRRVALVTDGRMSGASGKVPAAIHLTPEAADGGPIARLQTGDLIRLDAERGTLEAMLDAAELAARPAAADPLAGETGFGRELFAHMRAAAQPAELGAGVFFAQ
jgi:phosphogluconate dehydratase